MMDQWDKEIVMTRMQFKQWASAAKKGDSVEYHRGFLCRDKVSSLVANEIQKEAYKAYLSGVVTLVQRRFGTNDYSYIAQAI